MPTDSKISIWLKVAYTAWMLVWVPAYSNFYGPQNFLWLCDLCNFILLVALWTESRLLFSSQFVAALLIDAGWSLDAAVRLLAGVHPIGGTEYMFNPAMPLHIRLLSLFHVFIPLLLIYAVIRLGYDWRGLLLQTVLTWVVLPLSFLFTDPERNINWVWGLFDKPQSVVAPWAYLLFCMAAYPLAICLPSHGLALLICRWQRR